MLMRCNPHKKYYLECFTVLVVFCIFAFLLFCFVDAILATILSVILYLLARLLIKLFANKNFLSILFNDLDPQQFQNIIFSNKKFIPPVSYRIYAAVYSGNYQTAINICVNKMREKSSIRNKCSYLTVLAHIYFELGDIEKLNIICNKFYEYCTNSQKRKSFEKRYPFIHYCFHFINAEFEECIKLCEENDIKSVGKNNKLFAINQNFKYAMAFYYLGKCDEATWHFNQIIQTAPKLHLSSISQKYLEVIHSNSKLSFSEQTILPNENYQIFDDKILTKQRKRKIIFYVIAPLSIVAISLSQVFIQIGIKNQENESQHKAAIIAYENKLNAALNSNYDTFEVIEYFDIFYNDKYIETLCLVVSDNQFDLISIVSYDNGETFDLISIAKSIETGSGYYAKSSVSNYYLSFKIYQSPSNNWDKFNKVIEFQYNDKTLWFCLECINANPK